MLGIRNVAKSYGDKRLFEGITLKVEGGERIALIGDNGTGKSTLIKMIMGELYPDDGRIKLGPQAKPAYLPQIIHFDHPDWNLVENMMASKRGLSAQSARNRLAAYDFRGEDVFKPVSVLFVLRTSYTIFFENVCKTGRATWFSFIQMFIIKPDKGLKQL